MKRKVNAVKGKKGFQRSTAGADRLPTAGPSASGSYSSAHGSPTNTSSSYGDMYSTYSDQAGSETTWYRAYDSKNRDIGMYQNHLQAHHAAMTAGGWVREYDKKPEEGLIARLTGDGRSIQPTDGGSFEIPELSPFDRPAVTYTVVDGKGESRGSFEDEWEARIKAEELGGSVDKYVLKPAYRYAEPRKQMSFWERLRDNGKAYKKAKKR